jgi:hypothetical protein
LEFNQDQISAMKDLKQALLTSPALRPIDYTASATQSSIETTFLNFYQFSRAYFHFNHTHQQSWDPLTAILRPPPIFKFNYGAVL